MVRSARRCVAFVVSVALLLFASDALAAIFCPDQRDTMPMQATLPWGAVGYLNNGCTATLIDKEHIQAAAHCFVDPKTGAWQTGPDDTGLRFYPNYHPDRANPPWHAIDRVVVGSRTEAPNFPPPAFPAMDWGIAHLVTPVTDFASMPILPAPSWPWPVTNAGYQRDPIIFGAGDGHYVPAPRPPEPDIDPICVNCWWQSALVVPACEIVKIENHIVYSSCSSMGGSSGSPLFWSVPTTFGTFRFLAGSVFGGPAPDFSVDCEPFTLGMATIGPTAESFQFAPRLSHGVALATQFTTLPSGLQIPFTKVYSTDGDTNRIVQRRRDGFSVADPFRPFAVDGTVPQPRRMAALNRIDGRYRLFVTSNAGDLYSRAQGGSWVKLTTPGGSDGVVAVDTLYNVKGTDRVFIVTGDGRAFSRRFALQRANWSPPPSADEPYQRIAAVEQANGRARVFLLTASGRVLTTAEVPTRGGGLRWQTPQPFSNIGVLPPLVDIDAAWVADGPRIRLFAVDQTGGLWTRQMKTTSINDGWHDWVEWVTFLSAPQISGALGSPPPESIVSLTASHWREAGAADPQPVVFVTDTHGNVYYTTESQLCRADGTCMPIWYWLSFYHY